MPAEAHPESQLAKSTDLPSDLVLIDAKIHVRSNRTRQSNDKTRRTSLSIINRVTDIGFTEPKDTFLPFPSLMAQWL